VAYNAALPVKVDVRKREQRKLAIGQDFPSKSEVQAMLATAGGRWRPLLVTAVYTGMRASELRGLSWEDVDFGRKLIHVRQRANLWSEIGSPKSAAGRREIPMAPSVVDVLWEWRSACPRLKPREGDGEGRLWLVFPNGAGRVESHANILNRGFYVLQLAAGIAEPDPTGAVDADGKTVLKPKYGLHALRHFFASWAIDQGFSPKRVQAMLGHSSIQMTFDVYGHLFPSLEDDHAKMAAGELALAG
jgi:integrase